MLSIYENFTNNIQNSNNSQNEEDVWISTNEPINDTYNLHVRLFNSNESNESLVCELAVMYNNKEEGAKREIVNDINITEDNLSIKNSNNNIIYNTTFPNGIMHHEFARRIINFNLNELTGLLEFSFNYEIKFTEIVSGKISGSINSDNFEAAFISNDKIVKTVTRPVYPVICNVLNNGKKINFDIVDLVSNKKTLPLNKNFLRDNNNFNIKIGENEISNTRKNIERKKLNFKNIEYFLYTVSIDLNETDKGDLNFTLENYNFIKLKFEGKEYNIFGPKIENKVFKSIKQDKSRSKFGDIKIKVVNGVATCEENCLNINDIISKEQGNSENSNKKNEVNLPLIIGVSVGGFVLLAIIVYYFMRKGKTSRGSKKISNNRMNANRGGAKKAGRGKSK